MNPAACFRAPRLLLPASSIDLSKWPVVACDQYTSEPGYWRRVAQRVGDAPSTLQLIFPEAFLGAADADERIARIQRAMNRYLSEGLLQEHDGAIVVERTVDHGVRRGLMVEIDLEQYDFRADSTSAIRPTEGTMVERLAPRLAVRRGAAIELPHVLVLFDDPSRTVIEPLAERGRSSKLYEIALMEGGGRVAGYAVDPAGWERASGALRALADPAHFCARYGVPAGTPPMLLAVGDGNHSLATAKASWDAVKPTVGFDHPARYALVEALNIHDPALAFAPIHRLLFGFAGDLRGALVEAFGARVRVSPVGGEHAMRECVSRATDTDHVAGFIEPGGRFSVVEISQPDSSLAVATFQSFVDGLIANGAASGVDYIHGDDVLARLATEGAGIGLHLPTLGKEALLRRVVREGPLPRKTFSMGEAHEKRFYVEARRIR